MNDHDPGTPPSFWSRVSAWFGSTRRLIETVETPWRDSEHPMELRMAILEEVANGIVGIRAGKRIYPFNHLRIHLLAQSDKQRAILDAAFSEAIDLLADIKDHLTERGCAVDDLVVEWRIVGERTAEMGEERRYFIEKWRRRRRKSTPSDELPEPPQSTAPPILEFEILDGQAQQKTYRFDRNHVFLGRLESVTDATGHVIRLNDVIFGEDDEISRSVSREHARIVRRDQEAWLVDDRSAGGTHIFRDGRTIRVSSRDPRGVRLQPGDVITLGRARIQFALGVAPPTVDDEGPAAADSVDEERLPKDTPEAEVEVQNTEAEDQDQNYRSRAKEQAPEADSEETEEPEEAEDSNAVDPSVDPNDPDDESSVAVSPLETEESQGTTDTEAEPGKPPKDGVGDKVP